MTFEKRLQAHQEAYRLAMSAGEIINQPDIEVHKFAERLLKITNEAREWLNNNCLYIDKRSHQALIQAFFAVSIYCVTVVMFLPSGLLEAIKKAWKGRTREKYAKY